VTSADLGGLGAKEGLPVTYDWKRASALPVALPWLATALLLTLRPNRRAQAWWIVVPMAGVAGAGSWLLAWSFPLPSRYLELLQDLLSELSFALGAAWLVAGYLRSRSRIRNVLGLFAVLLGFSGLYYLAGQDWTGLEPAAVPQTGVFSLLLPASTLAISMALGLAGWLCRRRYRPLALSLWIALMLPAPWLLVLAALSIAHSGSGGVSEFASGPLGPVLIGCI